MLVFTFMQNFLVLEKNLRTCSMFVSHPGASNDRLGQLIATYYACLFVHFYRYIFTGLIFPSCSFLRFLHVSDIDVSPALLFALLDACKPYQSNRNINFQLTFLAKKTT